MGDNKIGRAGWALLGALAFWLGYLLGMVLNTPMERMLP